MAWAHVQSASALNAGTGGTTQAVTLTSTPTTGHKILVFVSETNSTAPTISSVKDSNGNSLTAIVGPASNGSDTKAAVYAYDVPATPSATFTATFASTAFPTVVVQEVSGLASGTTGLVDGTPGLVTVSSSGGGSLAGPAYTTTAANEYLVVFYFDNGSQQTATAPTGYTAESANQDGNFASDVVIGYKNSAGGSETTGPFTQTGGSAYGIYAFALKLASVTTVNGAATVTATASITAGGSSAAGQSTLIGAKASVAAGATLTKAGAATAAAVASVAVAPAIPYLTSVSSNGRYFVDQFGKPFLVNSDAAWGLNGAVAEGGVTVHAQSQANILAYIQDRAANGFNATIITVGGATSSTDANGNSPFTSTSPVTLNSAYWANVDYIVQTCAAYGITVWLDTMNAYSQWGQGWGATQGTAYGNALGARYKNSPNIVWFLGNDYAGDGVGSGVTDTLDPQYEAFLTALRAQGANQLCTIELGYNESNSTDSSTWASRVSFNTVYSYQLPYNDTLRAYAYSGSGSPMPAYFFEGVYENPIGSNPSNPIDLRKLNLWPLTCGAAGTCYGNDALWPFGTGWQSQLDTSDVAQRKAIMAYWNTLAWERLVPDTTSALVTAGRGSQYTTVNATASTPLTNDATYGHYVTAAVASDGSLGVIYNPSSATLTLSATPLGGGSPTITRVDPTNGATTSVAWTTSLASPGNNAGGDPDWLYVLEPNTTATGSATIGATASVSTTGTVTKAGAATPGAVASVAAAGVVTKLGAVAITAHAAISTAGSATPATNQYAIIGATTSAQMATLGPAIKEVVLQARWDTLQPNGAGTALDSAAVTDLQNQFAAAASNGKDVIFEFALHYTPAWVIAAVEPYTDQVGNTWVGTSANGDYVANWIWTATGRSLVADFLTKVTTALGSSRLAQITDTRIGGGPYGETHYPTAPANTGTETTPTNSWYGFGASQQSGTGLAAGLSVCPLPGYVPLAGGGGHAQSSANDTAWVAWYMSGLTNWLAWFVSTLQGLGLTQQRHMVLHPGYGARSNQSLSDSGYLASAAAGEMPDVIMASYASNSAMWPWCTWIDGADGWTPPSVDSDFAAWKKIYSLAVTYGKSAYVRGENTSATTGPDVMASVFANAMATSEPATGYPQNVDSSTWHGYRGLMWLNYAGLTGGSPGAATLTDYQTNISGGVVGIATISAAASVITGGVVTKLGAAAVSAAAAITAGGIVASLGAAHPAGTASIMAGAGGMSGGTVTVTALASVTAAGLASSMGAATLAAHAAVTAGGLASAAGSATVTAAGSVTAAGISFNGAAAFTQAHVSIVTTGTVARLGSVTVAALANVTAGSAAGTGGATTLQAVAAIIAAGIQTTLGAASPAALASVTTTGTATASPAGATITAQAAITAGPVVTRFGAANPQAFARVLVGIVVKLGAALIQAVANVNAAGAEVGQIPPHMVTLAAQNRRNITLESQTR